MSRFIFALLVVAVSACADSEPEVRKNLESDAAGEVAPRAKAAVPDPLPAVAASPVRWDVDLVAQTMKAIGLEMQGGIVALDASFLSPRGYRMMFRGPDGARAEVRAFVYGDAGAVGRDLGGIDTVRVAPRGTSLAWGVPARLITDNNLVAIILTDDAGLREKIRATLTKHEGVGNSL